MNTHEFIRGEPDVGPEDFQDFCPACENEITDQVNQAYYEASYRLQCQHCQAWLVMAVYSIQDIAITQSR